MRKPKTDTEILDYMSLKGVIVVPPTDGFKQWRVIGRESKHYYWAQNLRDAVLKMAYDKTEQD